ncbi:MAG: phosphate acyltransferase PlsX [Candidatus Magnetoovum sp. WYHC-5]|nr:phosphate acyltransferase PlsX [Candidatus Magnetoovum sp. WYHC-5]
MIVALDAMGGDNAPDVNVEGAIEAIRETDDIEVILVGNKDVLTEKLHARLHMKDMATKATANMLDSKRITIRHSSEVVEMNEAATLALRKKKDSSIRVAVDLVKSGEANAVVSAGHSGVAMTTALLYLGKLSGVDRPAIGVVMPTLNGRFLLIDSGANVDCKPVNLLQFAYMGSAYVKTVFAEKSPRIGMISIGEEDTKGNELTKEAFKLLKDSNLNFVGNIEGKDVFFDTADVVVCDGFIGNTVLKLSEGLSDVFMKMLKRELSSLWFGKLSYLLLRPAIRNFKKLMNYEEYGGAPLLGIDGTCIISHGRSTAKAIRNAIKVANKLAKNNLHKQISEELSSINCSSINGKELLNVNCKYKEKEFVKG